MSLLFKVTQLAVHSGSESSKKDLAQLLSLFDARAPTIDPAQREVLKGLRLYQCDLECGLAESEDAAWKQHATRTFELAESVLGQEEMREPRTSRTLREWYQFTYFRGRAHQLLSREASSSRPVHQSEARDSYRRLLDPAIQAALLEGLDLPQRERFAKLLETTQRHLRELDLKTPDSRGSVPP